MTNNQGRISFHNININAQSSNAGVFIGTTRSERWRVKEKTNASMGPVHSNGPGDSPVNQNHNLLFDNDVLDHELCKM